jgi:hypothetical protein
MARSRFRWRSLLASLALSSLSVLAAACSSSSPDQQLLLDFFRAARLHDTTTLANIAAVSFDPRTAGSVQQFTITGIGSEQRVSEPVPRPAAERAVAVSSLTPPGRPDVDLSSLNVSLVTRQVSVSAQLRTPDGQTVPRTLLFTFERAVGTRNGSTVEGRWMIRGLKIVDAAKT